ncbi:MAG: SRPBCC domain-containing protein [Pseudomonadota bacterium]
MTKEQTPPIRKTVTVPLDPLAAFELFAKDIDRWWPKETHSLAAGSGKGAQARVRVEPRPGGRVIETLPDGTEAPWADVEHYIPGTRLTLRWYVGQTPEQATLVDVRFSPVDTGTRVDLSHSGFETLGAAGSKTHASYHTGWDRVLVKCFADACTNTTAAAPVHC